jgi:hypothetical protein
MNSVFQQRPTPRAIEVLYRIEARVSSFRALFPTSVAHYNAFVKPALQSAPLYCIVIAMTVTELFRVVEDDHTLWDGTQAVMVAYDTEDWCIYTWMGPDNLLRLDYFDAEGNFVDWEAFFFSTNPLPTMWEEGDNSTDAYWYTNAVAT